MSRFMSCLSIVVAVLAWTEPAAAGRPPPPPADPCADAPCDDRLNCTTDACIAEPSCADGTAAVDGLCFVALSLDDDWTWHEARAACQAEAGDLAQPVSDDANDAAWAAADAACGDRGAFIGAYDNGAGIVRWLDGRAVDDPPWDRYQPALVAGVESFAMLVGRGRWAVTEGALDCIVCAVEAQPYTCEYADAGPDAAEPEVCDGIDNDCDGDADEQDGASCDDGSMCTVGICTGVDGCLFEDVGYAACDDGVGCTADACDAVEGCSHEPDHDACDDGLDCTADSCHPELGCVNTPIKGACDDGQACTEDVCTPSIGCEYVPVEGACDDGVACTVDTCTPFRGCDSRADAAACDDGNPCTGDQCDASNGCSNTPLQIACDDGDVCTPASRCRVGECVGVGQIDCGGDDIVCAASACDPDEGCVTEMLRDCPTPGPAGGLYTAMLFQHPFGEFPMFIWVVVDASRPVDVQGKTFSGGSYGSVSATIEGGLLIGQISAGQGADIAVSGEFLTVDGIPTAIRFTHGDFEFDLPRQLVEGLCCVDGFCEQGQDADCFAVGGTFVPDEAILCCEDGECTPTTGAACEAIGGDVQVDMPGRCCGGASACDVTTETLCEANGGAFTAGGDCADEDGDDWADGCGLPEGFGYSEVDVDAGDGRCVLDGDVLTVEVTNDLSLTLQGGWEPTADGYEMTSGSMTIAASFTGAPSDPLTLPAVTSMYVGCGAQFSMLGSLSAPPDLAGLEGLSSMAIVSGPSLDFGFAYGYEIVGEGIEGPFAPARPYLYVAADTGTDFSVSDNITIEADGGDSLLVGIDLQDPGFIFEVGGELLENATGGLVGAIGLGLSRNGYLTVESAVPLYIGDAESVVVGTGHIWRSGEFPLVPIPGLPVNIEIEGEMVVDVGEAADDIASIAQAIGGDSEADFDAIDGDTLEALAQSVVTGNANAINLAVGPVDLTVGNAAFHIGGGRLSFAGGTFDMDQMLGDNASGVLQALSAVSVQSTAQVSGYVEGDDWHFEFVGDYYAGPFALTDATIILDSTDGVTIEQGSFDLDFGAFLEQLQALMDCEFDEGVAACSLGGLVSFDLFGSTDGGFELSASIDIALLGGVDVSAQVSTDGAFVLTGSIETGLAGFSATSTSILVANDQFAVSSSFEQFGQTIMLDGSLGFDGDFSLSGSYAVGFCGFQFGTWAFTLDSENGLLAEGSMALLPGGGSTIDATMTFTPDLHWSLEGNGSLSLAGFSLGTLSVSAAAGDSATAGIAVAGNIGVAGAQASISGSVKADGAFDLSGSVNLAFGDFELTTVNVELNNAGARLDGDLDLFGIVTLHIEGEVEANGDFDLATSGQVNLDLPIPGSLLDIGVSVGLKRQGGLVTAQGEVDVNLLGLALNGSFSADSAGNLEISASTAVSASAGPVSVSGSIVLELYTVIPGQIYGWYADISGSVCLGDACVGAGAYVKASGNDLKACAQFVFEYCISL